MCLIALAQPAGHGARLLVAANRDEFFERPTAPAAFWEDHPHVLAGRDRRAGGTWLGVSRTGRFAAITNYRNPRDRRDDAPSRGALVSDFLIGTATAEAYARDLHGRGAPYNGFSLLVFDGRDPAAFLWAILEMEHRLTEEARMVQQGHRNYPVRLPYGIAVAPKGAGFFGSGTNLAHNLPLGANPYTDSMAAERFNRSARRLWVPAPELAAARAVLQDHAGREQERDNPLANRQVAPAMVPEPAFRVQGTAASPMDAIDEGFLAVVQANPHLRPRVGNPDEMKSNRLVKTLEALKFRVTAPERGIPEDVHGSVVTALNEETVAAAALGNKGGINLICTYEAFGVKMLGLVRQEVIFAKHLAENGRPPGWLSVPRSEEHTSELQSH